MAERILMNEFRTLSKEKWVNIELHDDDIFQWDVALIVLNQDSLYYGGYFKATMSFPANYPYSPPGFQFTPPLYHPNIYPDGKLCISILHPPGDDEMSGELAAERWSPAQRVGSVLISILSLLDDAEVSSPANVDAGVMLRSNPTEYRAIVQSNVEASKAAIPRGFEMPTHETAVPAPPVIEKDEADFWADSDDDLDPFGGSDSDEELDTDDLTGSDEEDEDTEKNDNSS
ncbi:Ubiquitin-conjugating enzyme subunit [Penicillium capsulatum]|nr:Ubiquitin-conjugating enzyme subunit [Penicillium capsulatum]